MRPGNERMYRWGRSDRSIYIKREVDRLSMKHVRKQVGMNHQHQPGGNCTEKTRQVKQRRSERAG